jgi:hypothetical protein
MEWRWTQIFHGKVTFINRCEIILRVYGADVNTNKELSVTTERADTQISDSNGKELGNTEPALWYYPDDN